MTASELAIRLDARRNGDGWIARCPAHDDRTPSLNIREGGNGRVLLKCHAGCELGDICAALDIQIKDLFQDMTAGEFTREANQIFNARPSKLNLSAVPVPDEPPSRRANGGEARGRQPTTGDKSGTCAQSPRGGAQKLSPLSAVQLDAVAKWRGYSQELMEWLNKYGLIGHYGGEIAFPVIGGVHYRKKDGSGWRYTKGAKPDLFVLGGIEEGAHVHCFESQWDALAFADASGERTNIVATRGAGNVKLLADKLRGHSGTIYLWPQNDEPGRKWACDIRRELPDQQIKAAYTHSDSGLIPKDLNEWRLLGATDGDVFNAMLDAKDFPVEADSEKQPTVESPRASVATPEKDIDPVSGYRYAQKIPAPICDMAQIQSVPLAVEPPLSEPVQANIADAGLAEVATGTVGASKPPITVAQSKERGEPDGGALAKTLDELVAFLRRYVVFPHDEQADVIALWIAHSWTFRSFRFTPYLNVCSPEKRCGKTRLLECIQLVVPRPRSMVRPTEAVLFRTIEKDKPTLLLDEIDTIYATDADDRSEGLRAVLNAGFQAGPFSKIPRCVGKDLEPRDFDCYCPKVIAGIGKNLPDTVLDRSIEIRLIRQIADNKASKFRAADSEIEATPLRWKLENWSRASGKSLAQSRPSIPPQLSDRQQDMMEPLIAIADEAGGEWPKRAREALVTIGATHEDSSTGVQLLADCRMVFEASGLDRMTSTGLIARLVEIESDNSPWPTWWEGDMKNNKTHAPARKLAKLLAPFGIKPATIRLGEGEVAKGYYKNDFQDAWKRYLEPVTGMSNMELDL